MINDAWLETEHFVAKFESVIKAESYSAEGTDVGHDKVRNRLWIDHTQDLRSISQTNFMVIIRKNAAILQNTFCSILLQV